ncbi:Serine/threonine-protein kinase SMG1-like [Oopsacas minuta]|uniref:Serine/threonine-protein kinase SMG1-like n=1 Tax=Oopsacas minuta TaxID=111878 RepID=A0AAV7JMI2_9METZ|nr:Serine/threonine-protein kinase SMG1-like [Oopsacas minuta]
MMRRRFVLQSDNTNFLPEHFKAIMTFILQGITPNRQSSDEWLGKMFRSCLIQHSSLLTRYEKMLISNTASNCDALLWYWAVFQCAHYCVHNKLQTFLGDPNKTFLTIESVLRNYLSDFELTTASEVKAENAFVYSGSNSSGLGPRHYTIYLRGILLLQFLEHLEKLVHNSYFGSIILSSTCKNSRKFFNKNISTCQEWFSRIHPSIMKMATLSGLPAMAVRCGFFQLESYQDQNNKCDLFLLAEALIFLKAYFILEGLGISHCLNRATWFQGTIFEARGNYECALKHYRTVICGDFRTPGSTDSWHSGTKVYMFCIKRLVQCFFSLGNFEELNLYFASEENKITYPNLSDFSLHNSELNTHLKQVKFNLIGRNIFRLILHSQLLIRQLRQFFNRESILTFYICKTNIFDYRRNIYHV